MWNKSDQKQELNCRQVKALWLAYFDGELSETQQEAVHDHLATCAPCAEHARQAQALEKQLFVEATRQRPRLSPQASARIRERVYQRVRRGLMIRRALQFVGGAVSVVAALALLIGLFAFFQEPSPTTKNLTPVTADPTLTSTLADPTLTPTPTVPKPSPVAATPTPTQEPAPLPAPATDWDDLTPYQAAMRPEFVGDVEQFTQATQYKIDLNIAPDLASYTATQQVHFVNTHEMPLEAVYFRLFSNDPKYGGKLTVSALRVNGSAVEPALEVDDTAMRVTLDPPLQPDDAANFEMHYTTEVPTTPGDFGYSEFGFYSNTLALPGFYPLIPAYDDEGWHIEPAPPYGDDVYSASALYQVNITAPANQVVATSGVCDAQAAGDGTTKTWRCVSGPMRDFMIVMSADYRIRSATVGGIQINSYYWDKDAAGDRKLLETAVSSVESFERRIGAYPFNELVNVETPTSVGAIEYPGLMVFSADGYGEESIFAAHEVAHQWWYSLVGNDPVNEPWLDEPLAVFMTSLWFRDDFQPRGFSQFIAMYQQRYNSAQGTPEDKRADLPVASYSSAKQYALSVYFKGALFFNALYEELGDEKFNAFLKTYFDPYRYGIADAEDLLQAMETQLDRATIDELLQQWITTP